MSRRFFNYIIKRTFELSRPLGSAASLVEVIGRPLSPSVATERTFRLSESRRTDDKPSAMMLASMAEVRRRKAKAKATLSVCRRLRVSERGAKSYLSTSEREQARRSQREDFRPTGQPMEQREQSQTRLSYAESRQRKTIVKGQKY